jgi:hypothetical protein
VTLCHSAICAAACIEAARPASPGSWTGCGVETHAASPPIQLAAEQSSEHTLEDLLTVASTLAVLPADRRTRASRRTVGPRFRVLCRSRGGPSMLTRYSCSVNYGELAQMSRPGCWSNDSLPEGCAICSALRLTINRRTSSATIMTEIRHHHGTGTTSISQAEQAASRRRLSRRYPGRVTSGPPIPNFLGGGDAALDLGVSPAGTCTGRLWCGRRPCGRTRLGLGAWCGTRRDL